MKGETKCNSLKNSDVMEEIFCVHKETYSKMWMHKEIGRDTLSNL